MSDIDVAAADHLLKTTKQVRQRLDLTRPVPHELILECIDVASHAPMGGNQERNRWLVVDDIAGYHGSVAPGVWSFQLAARARGLGSAWTTFHLVHERQIGELLGIPDTVTQIALLPVAYYTGDTFSPAPRRSATEITYLNRWKQPIG